MGRDNIRFHIIGRMLNWRKGIDILPMRQYNDSPWMLSRTSTNLGTSLR